MRNQEKAKGFAVAMFLLFVASTTGLWPSYSRLGFITTAQAKESQTNDEKEKPITEDKEAKTGYL